MARAYDVIVIGGGIIGAATAHALARRGASVLVLDAGRLAGAASPAAAGMVAPQAEAPGPGPVFSLALAARDRYEGWVRAVERMAGASVPRGRRGALYVATTRPQRQRLEARLRWQHRRGLSAVPIARDQWQTLLPALTPQVTLAAHLPDERWVDAAQLTVAVRGAARAAGARIRSPVSVTRIRARGGAVVGVATAAGDVCAPCVVNAAGAWAGQVAPPRGIPRLPVVPVRGQMLALRPRRRLIDRIVYSDRGYLVPSPSARVLVGSTVEHAGWAAHPTVAGIARLTALASALVPALGDAVLEDAWAGLRPATPDGRPIVGTEATCRGLVYAAGTYRSGITLAPLVAQAVADLVERGSTALPVAPLAVDRFRARRPRRV